MQKEIFSELQEKVVYINSPFKEAIKIPTYFEEHSSSGEVKEKLKRKYGELVDILDVNKFKDQLKMVTLFELMNNDVAIVESTGLSTDSVGDIAYFFFELLAENKNKIIVMAHIEPIGFKYPELELRLINDDNVSHQEDWLRAFKR